MILNLTQHAATAEQIAAGVVDCDALNRALLQKALTFELVPTRSEINIRAEFLASLAENAGACQTMIGGAPYLMSALENALAEKGIQACYAFSERVSVEKTDDKGNVVKTNVFRHAGFVL